jgi:LPXTG-motif cell wall-anchored protein
VSTPTVASRIWRLVHKPGVCSDHQLIGACVRSLTERIGQINICWSTLRNPIATINATLLNETFSILSSANPSAASYRIVDLRQIASPTSTSDSASQSSSNTIAVFSPTSSGSARNDPSSISNGVIGGIVGGVAGGLALLGIATWLLWRRRRNGHHEVAQDDMPELSAEDTIHGQMKA